MKKIHVLVHVFPFVILLPFLLCCGENKKTIGKAKIETVIYFDLTDTIKKLVKDDFIAYAQKNGWEKNGNRMELVAPVRNTKIKTSDGVEYSTDKDGFVTNISYEEKQLHNIQLSEYENKIVQNGGTLLEYPVLVTKKGNVKLYKSKDSQGTEVLRFDQEFGSSPDCCKNAIHVAADADPMDDERCLDYNGYSADGTNRPKSDPLAVVNFVGSDCSIAVIQFNCGLDHYNGGCFPNHGNKICSALIGHSTTYHTH